MQCQTAARKQKETTPGEIMAEETISVRIYQSDRDWLMDHRDSKRKGIADVLHEIIGFWEQCQNEP